MKHKLKDAAAGLSRRQVLGIASASTLSACGGGDAPGTSEGRFSVAAGSTTGSGSVEQAPLQAKAMSVRISDADFGPTDSYVELPSSIGTGSNSGIPNRGPTSVKVQYGTMLAPATGNNERAISSQAIVNATYPWDFPSHWSPNEFSVKNIGYGRVNALNAVLVTSTDLKMDNVAIYSYSKNDFSGNKTGSGGVAGLWSIVDTRGSPTRGVGAEFVMLHDHIDRYDTQPKGTLSTDVADANTAGVYHAGVRISALLSSKIMARGFDIISGSDNAGFDTGVNLQAFRSRALYIHNNLNASVGGQRVGVEFSDTVAITQKVNSPGGYVYQWEQNQSQSKGWYYTLRKDAGQTFFSAYADGTVTLSTSNTGAKLLVNPDGSIIAGHTTPTNAGFGVPQGGCFWLNGERTSYIAQVGSSIVIVKNGNIVASW